MDFSVKGKVESCFRRKDFFELAFHSRRKLSVCSRLTRALLERIFIIVKRNTLTCFADTVLQRKSAIGCFQTRKQCNESLLPKHSKKTLLRNTMYNLVLQTCTKTDIHHLIRQSSFKTIPLSWSGSGRHYRKWLVVWSWPMVLQRCGWSLPSAQDPSGYREEGQEKEKGQVKLNSTAHFPAPIRQTRSSIMLMERSRWQNMPKISHMV